MWSATLLSACVSSPGEYVESAGPARWVNPRIGASTSIDAAGVYHGLGKTFPGAVAPFGMVQVSPNTITGGDNGCGYSDEHRTIEGFAMTQMSGVGWYGDLGNFLVMPTVLEEGVSLQTIAGRENGTLAGWRSPYDKASEQAQAGYYAVDLTRYGIHAECTASQHCGYLRFTYPKSGTSRVQVDLARRVGGTAINEYVEVVDRKTIRGYLVCTPDGGGWGDGAGKGCYTVYFYATLSKPFRRYGFWRADIPDDWKRHRSDVTSDRYQKRVAEAEVIPGGRDGATSCEGKHVGFFAEFPTRERESVTMKVGISFVDVEGAKMNYMAEAARWSFDDARRNACQAWDEALSKVAIEGGTDDQRTVFYTALYHTMIDPRNFTDIDGRYTGGDNAVHESKVAFTKRTIFSGWDVFRSQMPLQSLINPRVVSDMINSLMTLADEGGKGYLERWEFLNAYSGCMLGNPALPMMADAWSKGIHTFDLGKAIELGLKTSQQLGNGDRGYSVGGTSISNTLENAYGDWCLGRMALFAATDGEGTAAERQAMSQVAETYMQTKGAAWKNIFDREQGWFRPRNGDGSWAPWPDGARTREGYGCCESDPWQQGWFVPHDIDGMVEYMGGMDAVRADLDTFFARTPTDLHWNAYYNHANEPVHFVPFLYNRLGQPWKTQYWTRFICDHAYFNAVEGLVGNEDVGQMSAWYVLSAAGLHPVCPGDGYLEITSPLFEQVTFKLDSDYYKGDTFTVIAHNNSAANVYIQRAKLNGKPCNSCHLPVSVFTEGGTLELEMGPTPNEEWGREPL